MADKGSYKEDETNNSFMTFVCNRRTGEFCGRTAGSWAKILIFYVIFYSCLAAFWAVMLLIFYQTIDYDKPKWTLSESRIGTNPGLGYRPRAPSDKPDSTLISFQSQVNKSFEYAINDIDNFFNESRNEKINSDLADHEKCKPNGGPLLDEEKFCLFDVEMMRTKDSNCSKSKDLYGYKNNEPCVLVKLNRIYGWVPENYAENEIPDDIKGKWKKNNILITCEGEHPTDKERVGDIEYYPPEGIPFVYFPFKNKPGYVSPFVWVKFKKPKPGLLLNIECKAWAKNIRHDRMDREGSVHFELMVN